MPHKILEILDVIYSQPVESDVVMATNESKPFIREHPQLFRVAQLLVERNEALLYWNAHDDLRFLLRGGDPDPIEEASQSIVIELCVFAGIEGILKTPRDDEDDEEEEEGVMEKAKAARETLRTILDTDCTGYWCADTKDYWVIDRFVFHQKNNQGQLQRAMDDINNAFNWRVCGCGQRIIKFPADAMCLLCQLTSTGVERAGVFCGICTDTVPRKHATTTTCCNQEIHRACLSQWIAASATADVSDSDDDDEDITLGAKRKHYTCPFCRTKQCVV